MFRSDDAQATYHRLIAAGMAMNPVQELARMAQVNGQEVQVRFQTVRFAQQPILGLRMYFCQHLTPQYVWLPELMQHPNGVKPYGAHHDALTQRLADRTNAGMRGRCALRRLQPGLRCGVGKFAFAYRSGSAGGESDVKPLDFATFRWLGAGAGYQRLALGLQSCPGFRTRAIPG